MPSTKPFYGLSRDTERMLGDRKFLFHTASESPLRTCEPSGVRRRTLLALPGPIGSDASVLAVGIGMSGDKGKTREQLLEELEAARRRNAELEALDDDRKRAEKALRESEEQFRTLVEQSPAAIEIYEPDGGMLLTRPCSPR